MRVDERGGLIGDMFDGEGFVRGVMRKSTIAHARRRCQQVDQRPNARESTEMLAGGERRHCVRKRLSDGIGTPRMVGHHPRGLRGFAFSATGAAWLKLMASNWIDCASQFVLHPMVAPIRSRKVKIIAVTRRTRSAPGDGELSI